MRTDYVSSPAKIGARIRRLRLDKGLSQRELAQPEMTSAYLSMIESGQRTPSPKAAGRLAVRLGVEVEEILSGRPSGLEARLELTLAMARIAGYRGRRAEYRAGIQEVQRLASRYGLQRLHYRTLVLFAGISERDGDLVAACSLLEEAMSLIDNDSPHVRFEAVVAMARCHHLAGDTRMAAHVLESYLSLLSRTNVQEPAALVRTHSALVQYYRALGLDGRAIASAEEAIRLAPSVDDPEQIACMNMNVARVLYEDGRYEDATDILRRAEQMFAGLDWSLPLVRARINRGMVHAAAGDLGRARDCLEEACRELESHPHEVATKAEALNELARIERLSGDIPRAVELIEQAQIHVSRSSPLEAAFGKRELGLCLAESDPQRAELNLRAALFDYRALGATSESAKTALELGRLLARRGDSAQAARTLEEGLALTIDEIFSPL